MPSLLRILLVLMLTAFAGEARAIQPVVTPVTDQERVEVMQQIDTQLGGTSHSFALLIGISEFDSPSWPHLQGITRELDGVEAALRAQNFKVTRADKPHLTLAEMKTAITEFTKANDNGPDDRLIIYIATHGWADKSVSENDRKDGYLITSDSGIPADGVVPNAYSVRDFSAFIYNLKAMHVFVFLDSCFSGAMLPPLNRDQNQIIAEQPNVPLSKATAQWTLHLLEHYARMILTAGDSTQTVPDQPSPFATAVVAALRGDADADGDGITLGSEIANFVRGRVARESRERNHPNDPQFSVLPRLVPPEAARPGTDVLPVAEYVQQGDFVFRTPQGPQSTAKNGLSEQQELLLARQNRLGVGQSTECVDCPTMVMTPSVSTSVALARTETTFAQWDACYREMGCYRYLPDGGQGRGDRPAGGMTWFDALQYVNWLNDKAKANKNSQCLDYRMPSAEEWRTAARYSAQVGSVGWSTVVADSRANCWGCTSDEGQLRAAPTGSSPANDAGLYDMVGNLWEWVVNDASMMRDDPRALLPAQQTANLTLGPPPAPTAAATRTLQTSGSSAQSSASGSPVPVRATASGCDLVAMSTAPLDQCGVGTVMGGSYATQRQSLEQRDWGPLPRTGIHVRYDLPTVGLRVACDLKPASP